MGTKITLFILDAVKASLLKMTLSFFSPEIWQGGKSDIQAIKTLRFIADAKVRPHPCKQRRQRSFPSAGPGHRSCGPGLRDNSDSFHSVALTKGRVCAFKIPRGKCLQPFSLPRGTCPLWTRTVDPSGGTRCICGFLVGTLEILQASPLHFSPHVCSPPHVPFRESDSESCIPAGFWNIPPV